MTKAEKKTFKLSDKKLQEKIGWKPFDKQKQIIEAYDLPGIRDIRIAAGTRFGKSMLCAYLCLRELLKTDRHVWIIAPTYDLSQKVFNYLVKWLTNAWPETQAWVQTRPIPQVKNPYTKSWVQCKSAENPAGLLGEELDLAIIDEAARMPRGKEIWEGYIYGRLISRSGKSVMISTPFGQNWFYHEYIRCKTAPDGKSFRFRSLDGVSVTKEAWERAKKMLPEQVFLQEYEASFLPDAAAVFRGVDEIIKDDCLQDAVPGHFYVMGVDLGKHEDFTVICVIDKYNNNVVYFDRFRQIDWPFQKKRIIATARRYNNARIIVDSTSLGGPIKEDLEREAGLIVDEFTFSGKSKKELIEKLSIYIEQKYIFIPNNEALIDELKSFGYQLTDAGNVKYSAPEGLHDDCVDALALAVWGLTGKANPVTALQKRLRERSKKKFLSPI